MDRYKKLASNTFIFAIGNFSSKLLVLFLMRFYTSVFTQDDYGLLELLVQTCNLLIPIATVGITHSMIRFGLERTANKQCVFTTGILTVLAGFTVLLCFAPLMNKVEKLQGYLPYLYLFIFMSSMQGICSQFARSRGFIHLYAVDGVFRTVLTIGLNVLFLTVFKLNVAGYLLANILTDLCSIVGIFCIARLRRFINLRSLQAIPILNMLRYSIPMIPNTVCTWIINISDRYILSYIIGDAATGLYAVANKIPNILIIISNIFGEAWQISAVTEDRGARSRFFSRVANVYQAVAFVGASGLIMTAKLSTRILASAAFYDAWICMPLLLMGTMFACLAAFLSSVYMVEKKSVYTFITTAVSAGANIVLNLLLIPDYGMNGAAFATFISYFIMFFSRKLHTQSFIRIKWKNGPLLLSFLLVSAQTIIMMREVKGWLIYEIVLFLAVTALNGKNILLAVKKLLF